MVHYPLLCCPFTLCAPQRRQTWCNWFAVSSFCSRSFSTFARTNSTNLASSTVRPQAALYYHPSTLLPLKQHYNTPGSVTPPKHSTTIQVALHHPSSTTPPTQHLPPQPVTEEPHITLQLSSKSGEQLTSVSLKLPQQQLSHVIVQQQQRAYVTVQQQRHM